MIVTVLGLGEAGGAFAADLASLGADVRGYDPAPVPTPAGVQRATDPAEAVADSNAVLALTSAADACTAWSQLEGHLRAGMLYADLSTSQPALKRDLAGRCADQGIEFAGVALMAPVPGKGLRTPALVSGTGAEKYRDLMTQWSVPVQVVGDDPGEAALRKLLRSVMMKGLAALAIEAMRGADAADRTEWLWNHLVEEITGADEALLRRLIVGTAQHFVRRHEEMEAAAGLLDDLGVRSVMTRAIVETLAAPDVSVPAKIPGS